VLHHESGYGNRRTTEKSFVCEIGKVIPVLNKTLHHEDAWASVFVAFLTFSVD
jgi:hypothetical protein